MPYFQIKSLERALFLFHYVILHFKITVKWKPLNVRFQKLNTINLNYSSAFPFLAPPLLLDGKLGIAKSWTRACSINSPP